jgi:hypothetical protein
MQESSTERLSPSSYKHFLRTHMNTIHKASLDQDKLHMGPQHYLKMEPLLGITNHSALTQEGFRNFSNVSRAFTETEHTRQKDHFEASALKPKRLPPTNDTQNAFNQSLLEYRQLVSSLAQINRVDLSSPETRKQLSDDIAQSAGRLSHYVTDLLQPLHATVFYTWRLPYPGMKTSHAYMEHTVMSKPDYTLWQSRFRRTSRTSQPLMEAGIRKNLLQQFEQSYLRVFDLVAGERKARQNAPADKELFEEQLKDAWRPIIEERMNAATQTLSDILTSAYSAAGKPNLNKLATDSYQSSSNTAA